MVVSTPRLAMSSHLYIRYTSVLACRQRAPWPVSGDQSKSRGAIDRVERRVDNHGVQIKEVIQMASYAMTCTCGQVMTLEAASRDEAVGMFKAGMTQQALDQHFREPHPPNEPKPTLEQAHAGITQMVAAV